MKLTNIPVADCHQSATNVKGRNEGQSFKDLVESIKVQGILVPVLARLSSKGYEVIAGNRRLAAAKQIGMPTIPAQLVVMTDDEARAAQIVENLQREGIHPLDEGVQYRELIGKAKYEIKDLAAMVGKSDTYVRQRLFLTNLEKQPADAYRTGKIIDGHAILIARLSALDQVKAFKAAIDRYNTMTVKDLKEWIDKNVYSQLDNQPWLKSKELMAAVGKCQECQPNRQSLFGDIKEGACTDVKCWKRKMDNYISHLAKTEKRTRVATEYGTPPKGILSQGEYVVVGKHSKDRCKSVHGAVVAQGKDLGKTFDICSDKACKTHGREQNEFHLSPKEVAAKKEDRKKEIAKAKKDKEDRTKTLKTALDKVKWPMSDKHLDALLALALEHASSNLFRSVAKRHELEPVKVKNSWGDGTSNDYTGPVKKFAAGLDKANKLKMAFELLIDTGYDSLRKGVEEL
jgi:ParB/RepB/Spo0J family partition protein